MDEQNQKWYHSRFAREFAQYFGIATVMVGLGVGSGKCSEYNSYGEAAEIRARAEAGSKLEYQRMKTIEEIVRAQGSRVTPEDFRDFLRENRLDGEGEPPEYPGVLQDFMERLKDNLKDVESPGK